MRLAEKGHEIVGVDCSDVALKTFISKHNISCSTERCVKTNGTLYQVRAAYASLFL